MATVDGGPTHSSQACPDACASKRLIQTVTGARCLARTSAADPHDAIGGWESSVSCSVKNFMITLKASPASSASTETTHPTKSLFSAPHHENATALARGPGSGVHAADTAILGAPGSRRGPVDALICCPAALPEGTKHYVVDCGQNEPRSSQ